MITSIRKYFKSHSDDTHGILFMLLACFWFSIMAVMIRHLSTSVPAFEMVFFRNLFSVICILPWLFKFGVKNIKTTRWNLYGYRTISGVAGMTMLFYAITLIPLTQTIALTFTVPLITALLAMLFLGERISAHKWFALIAGFVGVLIIVQPGAETFHFASLLVIATTCCWSASNILVKKLTKTDSPKTIVFLMMVIITPMSLPLALSVWKTPTAIEFVWLFVLGWVSNQAQFAMTNAYSKTDMHVVLPFDFSRLVFITILAYIFFGEVLNITTLLGALVIFSSAIYVARKEARQRVVVDASNEGV